MVRGVVLLHFIKADTGILPCVFTLLMGTLIVVRFDSSSGICVGSMSGLP